MQGEDAGEGQVEERQHTDFGGFDHVAAEAVDVAGPGRAGIDQRGAAGKLGIAVGIDAERGAAPIDMRVQVDQAGNDDFAGDVAGLGCFAEVVAEGGDAAFGEADIEHRVDVLRRVEHPSALENQIKHGNPPSPNNEKRRRIRAWPQPPEGKNQCPAPR